MTRSPPPSDESSDPRAARLKADTVVGSLTTLVDQQRSLAAGLDALAEDAPSWRLRRALRGLAGRLESGTPLEEALRADRSIPRPLVVAAEAGRETGRLLPVLQEYQIASEELSRHRWTIYGALSYPLALMLSSVAVVAFLFEWILPQFREVLSGFGVSLGTLPIFLFAISEFLATPTATWVLGLLLVAMLLLAIPVGLGVGALFSMALVTAFQTDRFHFPLVFEPRSQLFAAAITIGGAALAALIIRGRVRRLDLVTALRTRE